MASIGLATLILRDVQVAANTSSGSPDVSLFEVFGGTLDARHLTLALNTTDRVVRAENVSDVIIKDSIIWQPGDTLVSADGSETLMLSCNNASDSTTLPIAVTHAPGFRDTVLNPAAPPVLNLAEDSQNIDTCPNAPAPNPAFDLIGSDRLVDVAAIANLAGELDRGALEYQPPIFEDGFEDP